MVVGDGEITKCDMPSYIRGEDYPYRLYQMKQDLLNSRLQNSQQPNIPVQTAPVGNMGNQPNQWMGQ